MKILVLALRSLTRFKLYTAINILGLALSLTCVIIISRYVHSELSTDHFNNKLERIFTTTYEVDKRSGELMFSGVSNPNNEKSFVNLLENPAIERSSLFRLMENDSFWYKEQEYNGQTLATDSSFFQILDYPLLAGSKALTKPDEAVITEAYATKIFGKESPIGKQLRSSVGKDVTVAGVIGEPSTPSSIQFDIAISDQLSASWSRMPNSLALLHPKAKYQEVNKQYTDFIRMDIWDYSVRYQLYPLSDVYFSKNVTNYTFRTGNYTYVWILSLVAGMILLVGLFNFVNIYSVVILRRGREFGMKKVFGAGSQSVMGQLLAENMIMAAIAILIGWVLVEATGSLVRNQLEISAVTNGWFDLLLTMGILLVLPLFTALIPFIRYNYSTPITSLRSVGRSGGSIVSRKLFLAAQYIITFTLVISSLFFIKQLLFMLHTDPGIRTKDIIQTQFMKMRTSYDIGSRDDLQKERDKEDRIADEIKQKMDACPLFTHWTYGSSPVEKEGGEFKFKLGDGEFKSINLLFTTKNWLKLFNIQQTEGDPLGEKDPESMGYDIIISESAKKLFNITNINAVQIQPERRLWFSSGQDMKANPPYRIIGTFKDFNANHLSKEAKPLAIYINQPWRNAKLMASIAPGRRQEAIQFLKKLHDDTMGGTFEYTFIEDEYKALYQKDKQIALVYSIFALIAILISSLGLFSLSLFDVQQRYREIAIRKVNGATTSVVMRMLLRKYYKLLGIAFLIATPLSWLAITKYLENFAHKASISWWLFAVALLVTGGISLLTLIWQIRKASQTNPADAVKSE